MAWNVAAKGKPERGRLSLTSPFVVVALCLVALIVHLTAYTLDVIALGLLALAVSPWLAASLESVSFGNAALKFRQVEHDIARNEEDIAALKFMVGHFLTTYELLWLYCLANNIPFETEDTGPKTQADRDRYWRYGETKYEVTRLWHLGLAEPQRKRDLKEVGFEAIERLKTIERVGDHFRITADGLEFLRARERAVGPVDLRHLPTAHMTVKRPGDPT